MNRDSTLYQLDNAMAEFHYLMLQKMDPVSWVNTNQFMSYTTSSLSDVRREMENRYGDFVYPSMIMVRSPNLMFQSDTNVNNGTLRILQNNHNYDVRPVVIRYNMTIIDSRRRYIDEYYEMLLLNLHKYAPVLDIKIKVGTHKNEETGKVEDVIVHNKTQLEYDASSMTISIQPSYDDKTAGNGQIYMLTVPFEINTQLIGDYVDSKLIYELIANYQGCFVGDFHEVDVIPTVRPDLITKTKE